MTFKKDCFEYELISSGARITKYLGDESITTLYIPGELDGYPVRVIGESSFSENGSILEKIVLPPTVCEIEDEAFEFCLSLSELILNEGLEIIGSDICIVTSLLSISIPSTVSEIKNAPLYGHMELGLDPDNPNFFYDGYGLYSIKNKKCLIAINFNDDREFYKISDGTEEVADSACQGHEYIKGIEFPESLQTIGEAAFADCVLLSDIRFGTGLTAIKKQAFWGCDSLNRFEIGCNLEYLGQDVLGGASRFWASDPKNRSEIVIHPDNRSFMIDEFGFYHILPTGEKELIKTYCDSLNVTIPDDVVVIESKAFEDNKAEEVCFPSGIRRVERDAFIGCKRIKKLSIKRDGTVIYVPVNPVYRKPEILMLLSENSDAHLFDYEGYDALIPTYRYTEDRVGMRLCRLKYPVDLSDDKRDEYMDWLDQNFKEMLDDIYTREDVGRLEELYEIGYLNSKRLDTAINILSPHGAASITGYLMELKNKSGYMDGGFDFSL